MVAVQVEAELKEALANVAVLQNHQLTKDQVCGCVWMCMIVWGCLLPGGGVSGTLWEMMVSVTVCLG